MKTFKPSALTAALLVGGMQLSVFSSLVMAQEAPQAPAQEVETADIEVIQIKGFRRSLIESLNVKRFADTVVEAVSADDMGALPDVSIADSISRLPGVTAVRTGGQSSELNIRGLSGNFVFATLNGRELVSNQGGRSVQFDQYPSELINSAQVYKSQKASLIEGGVAGTIELKTANPLLNDKEHTFNVQVRGSYNDTASEHPDADEFGSRLSFAYQGKFLDNTLGLGFGYARLDQPNISTQFVNSQPRCGLLPYDGPAVTSDVDCDGNAVAGGAKKYIVPTSFNLNARGGKELRDGYVGTFTFMPTQTLTWSGDAFYSKFDSERKDRGIFFDGLGALIDGPNFGFTKPVLSGANNDVIVGGIYSGNPTGNAVQAPLPGGRIPMGFQLTSDDRTVNSEVLSVGSNLNLVFDDLSVSFDVSHSTGKSIYLDSVVRMALFDDARADFPLATNDYSVQYELNGLNLPTIAIDAASLAGLSDPNRMMVTALERYPNREKNEATSAKLDFNYAIDGDYISSIEAGVRWAERTHDFDRKMYRYGSDGDFLDRRNGKWVSSWDLTDPDNPVIRQAFAPYLLQPGDYSIMNIGGEMAQYGDFLAVNNQQIENAWLLSNGVDTSAGKSWANAWSFLESNIVTETTFAGYAQANLDMAVGNMQLYGNVGVRVIRSEQRSTGLQSSPEPGTGDCITDDFGVESCNYDAVEQGIDYTDVLPSMNLNLKMTDEDQLRFAVARVMARPEMPDMRVGGSWDFTRVEQGIRYADLNANTSPALKPFYAVQYDLSYEHYFTETEGAIVAALFYKDIKSTVQQTSQQDFNFASVGIDVPAVNPETGVPVTSGNYSAKFNNAEGGYIRGVELAYTQTFGFLPEPFNGLGFTGNVSYTESELKNEFTAVQGGAPESSPLPGLSKVVWSAAVFYDYNDVFSTRVNVRYRDDNIGNQISLGQSQQAFFKEELIVDYQASYQFNDTFQGVFSVSNITDEPNMSYFGEEYNTGTIQYYGRQYYVGVNAKF
ncbi:TonB-dependent receptor [Rheinheimera baltica]|uniref:TonB-dependent receptor n=1 Tax=Rheinheimera baltica TaxID=67576 RepID=UPI00273D3EE3|nr:TonB-dependent receptor [Rheinheimera baltica]MDP5142342.1 TonB-dependent receptor [Rheinheimera baltica]